MTTIYHQVGDYTLIAIIVVEMLQWKILHR